MSAAGDEEARRAGRARAVALFRYSLIREAADPGLSTRQRGRLVRELAAREHAGPFGEPVTVSRPSLDRWIRAWRSGGFDSLAPSSRQVTPRTPAEVLGLAAALKRENPARTAAQVARVLRASSGWSPSERTLQRHFARLELDTRPDGSPPPAFGRFEASRPNEMWTGDALHGPVIGDPGGLFATRRLTFSCAAVWRAMIWACGRFFPSSRPQNRVCRVRAACLLARAGSADHGRDRGEVHG